MARRARKLLHLVLRTWLDDHVVRVAGTAVMRRYAAAPTLAHTLERAKEADSLRRPAYKLPHQRIDVDGLQLIQVGGTYCAMVQARL